MISGHVIDFYLFLWTSTCFEKSRGQEKDSQKSKWSYLFKTELE